MRVITLNLAHGRRLAFQQLLLRRTSFEANLASVAAMLRREKPHVVALQEADAPSFWSGNFNHVVTLADALGVEHHVHGAHVHGRIHMARLSYGTALLSKEPLKAPVSHRFDRSLPTPTKGFVAATVAFPGAPGRRVTVVSVHLDFLRRTVRRRQVHTLARFLRTRQPPFIVLGDMNCSWTSREDTLRLLGKEANVRAHAPEGRDLATFPARRPRRRLDWILISPELEFLSYRVLPDRVSDHLAVAADVGLK